MNKKKMKMKRLHELFSFSWFISALINRGCRVNWMDYITVIFFSYLLSVLFFLYILISKRQEVIKKLLKNIQVIYL